MNIVSLTGTAIRSESSAVVNTSVTLESSNVPLADTAARRLIAVVTHRPVHVTVARYNTRHCQ